MYSYLYNFEVQSYTSRGKHPEHFMNSVLRDILYQNLGKVDKFVWEGWKIAINSKQNYMIPFREYHEVPNPRWYWPQ